MPEDDESGGGDEPVGSEGDDTPAVDDPEARARAFAVFGGVDLTAIPDFQAQAVIHANAAASADAPVAPGTPARAWTPIGPRNLGGAVREIVQDPNQPSIFYAGTAGGGAWKSVNEGLSWEPLGGPGDVYGIGAIAVARGDSRLVYVATGERDLADAAGQGLFVSTDGGRHLTRIAGRAAGGGAGDGDHYVRIALDPVPRPLAGAGRVTVAGVTVTRDGAQNLTLEFVPHDLIEIGSEVRVVSGVTAATLTLDRELDAPPAGPVGYRRVSRRFWVANELGLFRFEPGTGFLAEGPFPRLAPGAAHPNQRATDVRVVTDPAHPRDLFVYVGLHGLGLWRATFTEGPPLAIVWTQCRRSTGATANVFSGTFGRVLVTISGTHVYTIAESRSATASLTVPSHVFRSTTLGTVFTQRTRPFSSTVGGLEGPLGWYAMVLEVNPANAQELVYGQIHLWRSTNGGNSWTRINAQAQFEEGFRGQHADQHAALWDARPPPGAAHRLWVGHDGGLGMTTVIPTAAPFPGWRKRDYGMPCAQFYELATHPRFPVMTAGGLQDNGTWLSYGGLSWYMLNTGDGGALAFRDDVRRFLTTAFPSVSTAGNHHTRVGAPTIGTAFSIRSPIPDAGAGQRMRAQSSAAGTIAQAAPFVGVVEAHTTDGEILVGRARRVFRSTNGGTSFTAMNPQAPAGEQVRSIAFTPGQPSTVFWFGTSTGNVFRSAAPGVPGAAGNVTPPFVNAGDPITKVVSVAAAAGGGFRIAVATGGNQGEVFIADLAAHGAAVGWWKIDGTSPAVANRLPPGPVLSLAFDPTNERHLYAGTLAGVFGAHDLPVFPLGAPPAAPPPPTQAVTWRTFNGGLPLVFVQDMDVSPVTRTLRIVTNGRGAFERNIAGSVAAHQVRPVSLLIRNTVVDDGRTYAAANTITTDPRQAPTVNLDLFHSFDIRVDAPRLGWVQGTEPLFRELFAFGEQLEGSEQDDIVVHDSPVLGEVNYVYVQVTNRGHTPATDVSVHLFFAPVANAAGPPPDLQAGFRAAFPGEPPDGEWRRIAAPEIVGRLEPGTPAVVRFEWAAPLELGTPPDLRTNVALLALTDCAEDRAELAALPDDVVANVVQASRHAAVRITPVVANPLFLRDGVDDDGQRGSVAWGARSPDIVVLDAAAPASPHSVAAHRDLADQRLRERVRPPPAQNHLMVRVFNRTGAAVNADVDLWFVPDGQLHAPAQWQRVNVAPHAQMRTGNIPGHDWRFTNSVPWTVPAAHAGQRTFLFVAIASPVNAQPPKPDHLIEAAPPPVPPGVVVDDQLEAFWTFARSGHFADKVALRAVRRA